MIPAIPPIKGAPTPTLPLNSSGGSSSGGSNFSQTVGHLIDQLQQLDTTANTAEVKAAAGQGNVADAMIAATKASLATQVTVALTEKAVLAFTEIVNMQI